MLNQGTCWKRVQKIHVLTMTKEHVGISATSLADLPISEATWFYCSLLQFVSNHVKDGMDGS